MGRPQHGGTSGPPRRMGGPGCIKWFSPRKTAGDDARWRDDRGCQRHERTDLAGQHQVPVYEGARSSTNTPRLRDQAPMDVPRIHVPDKCPCLTMPPSWSQNEPCLSTKLWDPEVPDYGLPLLSGSGHVIYQITPGYSTGPAPRSTGGIYCPEAVVLARLVVSDNAFLGRPCGCLKQIRCTISMWGYTHYQDFHHQSTSLPSW